MKLTPLLVIILATTMIFSCLTITPALDWSFLWKTKPDQLKIAEGLKEALRVGTDNSVKQTARSMVFLKIRRLKSSCPKK